MTSAHSRDPAAAKKPLVIGLGAEHRGDDQIGLLAVRSLREESSLGMLDFSLHSDDAARIIDGWSDRDEVIVIDAVKTGAAPGTIVRLDLNQTEVESVTRSSVHGNALADAIGLSRVLGTMPRLLVLLGVEGERFGIGDEPSKRCVDAIPELVALVRKGTACMSRQ